MSASLEKSALEKAKEGIDALFRNWIIVPDTAIHLEDASFSTTESIQGYLEEHKSKEYFPELIHYALDKAEHLHPGLRLETLEYLWGGARRTVERSQYTQLMAMLKQYLPPEPSESYSFYLSAADVFKGVALLVVAIPLLSTIPVAAALSTSANLKDSESSGSSLQVDYEKALRDVAVAEQQMRALMQKMGRDYDAIPKEELHQPSIDIRKIEGKKVVDNLAKKLVAFYEANLTAGQEKRFISKLLHDPACIQPFTVIWMNAKDKEILYKVVLKLTDALYTRMFEEEVRNLSSLVMSFGQVFINTPPAVLNGTPQEVSRVVHLLFLYQSFSSDKTAVAEKMRALLPVRGDVSQLSASVILQVSQMNASKKTIIKSCFSELLSMTEESIVRPLREKEKAKLPLTDREKLLLLFMEVYLDSIQTVIQLFFEGKMFSIHEKYAMLKKIDAATLVLIEYSKHNSDNSFDIMWMKIYLAVFFDMDNLSQETLNEMREFSSNLKQRQEMESESGWDPIFLSSVALLSPTALVTALIASVGINYRSKPPEALYMHLSNSLCRMSGMGVTRKEGYYSHLWLTHLPYHVVHYQFLAFFNQREREAWLENRLSTRDFRVQVEAKEKELILAIKPKNWLPNWTQYFRHLDTISTEFICVKEKLTNLLKNNFSHVAFSEIFDVVPIVLKGVLVILNLTSKVVVVDEEGVPLELTSAGGPFVCRKIELLFREKGFKLVNLNKAEFKFMLPFSALQEGDFTESFKQSLNEIDAAVGMYIEKRNQYQFNLQALVDSFQNVNLSCEMGDLSASWTCQSGNVADLYILQYLLHSLYGVESKIESNQVIHDLPEESILLKPEAKDSMENMTAAFQVLEARYTRCERLSQEGKIYLKIASPHKMVLSLMEEELSPYGLSIQLKKGYILIDLSLKNSIDFKFEKSFAECLQNKKNWIEQEKKREALAEKHKLKEEKINTILKKLNGRLKGFLLIAGVEWKRISNTKKIGLVLEEKNYYCLINKQALFISKDALIELMRCDFIKNNDIKKEDIIEQPNKKFSLKSRLELQDPCRIEVGDGSIVERHFVLLNPLSRLAEIFYPLTISLNYVGEKFSVSLQCDEVSQDKSWRLSDEEFKAKFIERVWHILEGKAERAERGEFTLSLEAIKSIELPPESTFRTLEQEWLYREERAEIEILNVVEVSKDEKDKEDKGKGKEKEKATGKEKGKEKQRVKKQLDVSKASSSSFSSSKGLQFFANQPIVLFDEGRAKKNLETLLTKVKADLRFLEFPQTDNKMHVMQREFVLYGDLYSLLEALVECAKQFKRPNCIKPNWFNIQIDMDANFKALSQLRVDIIKNVNIPNHRMFCRHVARKISEMLFGSFNMNIQEMRGIARTEAVISEFEESGDLNTEEEGIEYDHIRALVDALKNGSKGGNIRQWVSENKGYVRALIIFTHQVFSKKCQNSLEKEMRTHLGGDLYQKLSKDGKICRNLGVHEPGTLQEEEEFVCFIVNLNTESSASYSSSYSASSKHFGFS